MLIKKGNITMNLDNENHLNAFLTSGWEEVKSSSQTVKEEPKIEEKIEAKVERKPRPYKRQEK